MSHDCSENILIHGSAGDLLQEELGWEVVFAYITEQLGEHGTLGRKSYRNHVSFGCVTAYPVRTVDTTGAGDAFIGAFLWEARGMKNWHL